MRQFDVVANPADQTREFAPFLVILQSHHLFSLDTTIVAPLFLPAVVRPDGLFALAVEVEGQSYTLAVQQFIQHSNQASRPHQGDAGNL